VLSAPVSKMNQEEIELLTFTSTKIRLLESTNGISSALVPEMNLDWGVVEEGVCGLFFFDCASAWPTTQRSKPSKLEQSDLERVFIHLSNPYFSTSTNLNLIGLVRPKMFTITLRRDFA
jgi:hypothetical protein